MLRTTRAPQSGSYCPADGMCAAMASTGIRERSNSPLMRSRLPGPQLPAHRELASQIRLLSLRLYPVGVAVRKLSASLKATRGHPGGLSKRCRECAWVGESHCHSDRGDRERGIPQQ
jgi:hypothetical protein